MNTALHEVSKTELPAFQKWLEQFLPESFKLYGLVRETIRGRWDRTTFYTLGWPNILAATMGPIQTNDTEYALFVKETRVVNMFSLSQDHIETLLLMPDFLDWTKPIIFSAIPKRLRPVFEKVIRSKGGNITVREATLMEAKPGQLSALPVPEGYKLRDLDPDMDTDYVASTWHYYRKGIEFYISDMIQRFPSIGLFDKDNRCIGLEISYEYGALGMLHVREEFRGQGFGQVIVTHLVQKYFCDDLPVYASTVKSNRAAVGVHLKIGFKPRTDVDYIVYDVAKKK